MSIRIAVIGANPANVEEIKAVVTASLYGDMEIVTATLCGRCGALLLRPYDMAWAAPTRPPMVLLPPRTEAIADSIALCRE